MKRTKIYIKPYHLTMNGTQSGFQIHLFGRTNEGKGKDHEIVFTFDMWWVLYFLKDFKRIVVSKIDYLKEINNKINVDID
jgi:hypothetical protein